MFGSKKNSKSPKDTGGPVVKSGPTRGQNRSRNTDGQWRAKRSDAGSSKKSKCYLTTAACEHMGRSDDCYELQTLRTLRDSYMMQSPEGRRLVAIYYETAPSIVANLKTKTQLDYVWGVVLQCVASIESGDPEQAVQKYREMALALGCQHIKGEA